MSANCFDARFPGLHRAGFGRGLAQGVGAWGVIDCFLERRDLGAGDGHQRFELLLPTERGGSGIGANAHAVLGDGPEFDVTCRHQTGELVREQLVQYLALPAAKVGDGMVIDLNATADPAVGVVILGQADNGSGAANAF
jgi:hypothetical protein